LEIFTLHHCAMNRRCGGWVSSFIIICYGYISGRLFACLCGLKGEKWSNSGPEFWPYWPWA